MVDATAAVGEVRVPEIDPVGPELELVCEREPVVPEMETAAELGGAEEDEGGPPEVIVAEEEAEDEEDLIPNPIASQLQNSPLRMRVISYRLDFRQCQRQCKRSSGKYLLEAIRHQQRGVRRRCWYMHHSP